MKMQFPFAIFVVTCLPYVGSEIQSTFTEIVHMEVRSIVIIIIGS